MTLTKFDVLRRRLTVAFGRNENEQNQQQQMSHLWAGVCAAHFGPVATEAKVEFASGTCCALPGDPQIKTNCRVSSARQISSRCHSLMR
jgi:hypothetical protein